MKKNELLNKIKTQALNEMPDVFNRINIDNIYIEENEYEAVRTPFNLRRAFSYTFASLFILVSGFMIYNFGYLSLVNDSNPLESETELIGFQTVSAASLLSEIEVTELNSFDTNYFVTELSQTAASIKDEIELINSYMNLAETVIGDEKNYVYNSIESDNPEYLYAFEYKGSDLKGNLITYKAYYNKSTTLSGDEIISGIISHNQKEYQFTSTQVQNGEITTNQYRIYINSNNYVEVMDSSNKHFQKFTYQVYKDGNLQNSSEMTITSFKNNIKASMMITKNENSQLVLEFERNSTDFDNQGMMVKYNYTKGNNLQTGEFYVNLVSDSQSGVFKYQYKFDKENIVITNRNEKGNTKATEDDFKPVKGNRGSMTTSTVSSEDETTTQQGPGQSSNPPGTSNDSPGNSNYPGNSNNSQDRKSVV